MKTTFSNFALITVFCLFFSNAYAQESYLRYHLRIKQTQNPIQVKKTIIKINPETKKNDTTKFLYYFPITAKNEKKPFRAKRVEVSDSITKGTRAFAVIDEEDPSILRINYYLGNAKRDIETADSIVKYDYYIKMENRSYESFCFSACELATLSIPFKYRTSFSRNNMDVSDALEADVNISSYLGHSWGKVTYQYRKHEKREPYKRYFSTGVFAGFSRIEIDSSNTFKTTTETVISKKGIIAFTSGIAAMTSIRDFRIGLFVGTDIAIGSTSQRWHHHKRAWFGIGLGYRLAMLGTTGTSDK